MVLMVGSIVLVAIVARVVAFPGASHLHPTIHFAPDYVANDGGWHDIAGALTHKGVHHIYQGEGWNHALSTDLVHWTTGPHGPKAIREVYRGMDSLSDPCSGFLTKDVDGTVCAGFRQCDSSKGVEGGHPWDVPLELRCALDDDMTVWSEKPEYLFNVTWYRHIPYDPARPWVDEDGKWYVLLSMDGCNSTTQKLPCQSGGQLQLWRSPALRGKNASWEHVGPVFTSSATVLQNGHLSAEFVTIDYVGKLPGDPSPEADTRLFFNNVGGNGGGDGCCSGTTSYFVVTQSGPGMSMVEVAPQQMVDWGAFLLLANPPDGSMGVDRLSGTASRGFSMARTLGSEEANQVAKPGRRVMIGWTGPGIAALSYKGSAQSLPRELSLGSDYSLKQRFIDELKILRMAHISGSVVEAGLQAEVLATFTTGVDPSSQDDFGVSVLGESGGNDMSTRIILSPKTGLVMVNATLQGNDQVRAGPLPLLDGGRWTVHAIVDHSILEVIVNNATALVVYVAPPPEAGRVELFGLGTDGALEGTLDVWPLKSAHSREVAEVVVV